MSEAVTDRWNPYVEAFWFSRTDVDGTSQTTIDAGLIYELGAHYAIDGGAEFGVTGASADFGAFAGLSILVGGERNLVGRHRKINPAFVKPR